MKEKVGTLERELGKEIINSLPLPTNFDKRLPLENKEEEEEEDFSEAEDERGLEPTPLASLDAAYEADGEDDELLDLGIQIGRMRITERIGGFFRPKLAEEVSSCDRPLFPCFSSQHNLPAIQCSLYSIFSSCSI